MADLTVDIREMQGLSATAIVTLNGPIDARTVISFKTQIESAKGRGLRTFVMDMEKVSYINSTGLSYLISIADSGDPSRPGIVLLKIQAKVKVLFDMMGLGPLFKFVYSLDEALQSLGAPASAKAASPPAPAPSSPPHSVSPPAEKTSSTFLPPPPPPKDKTPLPAPPPREKTPVPAAPAPSPSRFTPPPSPSPRPATAGVEAPLSPPMPGPPTARLAPPPTVRAMAEPLPIRPSRHEDWISLGLAVVLLGIALAGLRPPMASFQWASDGDFFAAAARCKPAIDHLASQAAAQGDAALAGAAASLRQAYEKGDRAAAAEAAAALAIAAEKSPHPDLRSAAGRIDRDAGSLAGPTLGRVFEQRNLLNSALMGIVLLILAGIASALMGGRLDAYALGFPLLFSLAWLAQVLGGNIVHGRWGVDTILWATLLGLLVANSTGVPAWMREVLRSELYLKTGLVLMGAGIVLPRILEGGLPVVLQGATVAIVAGIAGYFIARLFRVNEDFSAVLSASAAVGGMPAAIGSLLSVRGDRRKLPYVVGLTFVVSLGLAILMPWLARRFSLSDAVGGAWMGLTIDNPASALTAGTAAGEESGARAAAARASLDGVLLILVLFLSVVWARRHGARGDARPGASSFWAGFPMSVLGFVAACIVFSYGLPPSSAQSAREIVAGLRDFWLAMAFVSIGLETRFSDMVRWDRGRPAAAFLLTQVVNALGALALAMALWGGAPKPLR